MKCTSRRRRRRRRRMARQKANDATKNN